MPAAQWTTTEQSKWLQALLPAYIQHTEHKNYSHFWPDTYTKWCTSWPERAVIFPGIPMDVSLTKAQENDVQEAIARRKNVRFYFLF